MSGYHARRRHDPEDSQAHAHRRETDANAVLRLHDRVDDNERAIQRIDATLGSLVASMKGLTDNTGRLADVLEAWNNVKGFWWTLKLLGGAARILLPLLAIGGAVWVFLKTGVWNKPS